MRRWVRHRLSVVFFFVFGNSFFFLVQMVRDDVAAILTAKKRLTAWLNIPLAPSRNRARVAYSLRFDFSL